MNGKRILVIVTSQDRYGTSPRKTGYWLSEVSHPVARFKARDIAFDVASPRGGAAPVDPDSLDASDPMNAALLADRETRQKLENTLRPEQVRADAYDALFFAGGMGTMWDFAQDERLGALAVALYAQGKPVAAVCHGPAALLSARTSDGRFLLQGRAVAAFSNEEETLAQHDGLIPYYLETALVERGAIYEKAPAWQPKVVVSERLITGQNPASAGGVAAALLAALA